MVDELSPKRALAVLNFSVANAVTQQTNTDLALPGGNTVARMPKPGSIVGISARASADLTAGSATIKAHKDGTEYADASAPTLTLDDNNQEDSEVVRPGALVFAAGDGIGVSYSSTTDMAPTNTNDFDVQLYVAFDPD